MLSSRKCSRSRMRSPRAGVAFTLVAAKLAPLLYRGNPVLFGAAIVKAHICRSEALAACACAQHWQTRFWRLVDHDASILAGARRRSCGHPDDRAGGVRP